MIERVETARRLITSKDTASASMRTQSSSFNFPSGFQVPRGNVRERRISVAFDTADVPVCVEHGLGFAPTGYTVMGQTAGGSVYNDFPLPSSKRVIVLKCDTANVVADILVR